MKPSRWTSVLLTLGLLQTVLAAVWWASDDGKSAWPEKQATAFQQAAATLHRLSGHGHGLSDHTSNHTSDRTKEIAAQKDEYQEALAEFSVLKEQFQYAKNRKNVVSGWLLVSAGFCFVLGIAGRTKRVRKMRTQ